MPEDQAARLSPSGLQLTERQARGRRRHDGGAPDVGLDLGVQVVLEAELLGHVLLDELRRLDGGARVVVERQCVGAAPLGQSELGHGRPRGVDCAAYAIGRVGVRVEDGDRLAGAQEERCPALPDDAAAEDGDVGDRARKIPARLRR
jgi:hypothetical protein